MKQSICFTLNGERVKASIEPHMTLLNMLREVFDLTGAKEGCGGGECGACTVLVNHKPMNACLILGVEADGLDILTVEGLSTGLELDALQQSFIDHAALQCGYCTPGMIMSAKALLMENPTPTANQVVKAISGNLCRCTGYKKIIEAVMDISNRNLGQ
jgi:carbon-monoxide dehydrogenase small subunit